ncbi:DSBA-like thioredoxin domain protein [Seminavis robusta]|uniref:DSBA-like thioredoxin domain protein n=1 Tax=Seminavis robusta TaxID=568900 RepID=A0A9N8E0R0_9STRA|nr:DSBA-like thioredoxin domain protein [Seminavis robusta]|eukprot:Sro420_g139380.1 DSBA-like thioredoxin domain protein (156) ;mRNA; f:54001-54468
MENFGDPNSHLMRAGRQVGIHFKTDRNVYPTVQAHALMEYVKNDLKDVEKSNRIMEELYKRYFEHGENINSVAVLQQIGATFGLEQDVVEQVAQDDTRHRSILQKDHLHKARMHIRGVPFYIIEQQDNNSRPVGFSGAQPPAVIAEYLREAAGLE